MWTNGPEYEARLEKPFRPPRVTLKQIHDAVPKELLRRDPLRSSLVIVRDVVLCSLMFYHASRINSIAHWAAGSLVTTWAPEWILESAFKTLLWVNYCWWQGIVFASFFCIAHELGHEALFDGWWANTVPGFILDTFILVPFFAWKHSHNAHHRTAGSLERDENYIPHLRSEYGLPPEKTARRVDYLEMFEETPIMTFGRLLIMQGLGWWLYLSINAMGSKRYKDGANHFSPYSPIFNERQRKHIIASDIGLGIMISLLVWAGRTWGWQALFVRYFVPYLFCNHWIVLFTFLHHSDPTIPHYRKEEWSFVRGASATVDRPIMGWVGRLFFHNVSHDHVAHHFFSHAPFYNQPKITKAIQNVLKEDYNYDSTPAFYALYRSFTQCQFIEDEGEIVFYKNRMGEQLRELAPDALGAEVKG